MLGGTPVPRLPLAPWTHVIRVGQVAPLPSPHVRVMGCVSGESSEGGVLVLTVKLWGMGVIRRIGDVAALPSSGLPRRLPRFRASHGHPSLSFGGVLWVSFSHRWSGLPSASFGVIGGCGQRDGDATSRCLAL